MRRALAAGAAGEGGRVIAKLNRAELSATVGEPLETEAALHAYARVLADSAREEARIADRELAAGRWRGPLHGVPVAVKDLCYIRGVEAEAGSRAMAGFVPDHDATIVLRLREAGAPILGKTVTHEFAYGQNIPPTRNPWDLAMYPGGSSAGSGVARVCPRPPAEMAI